MDEKTENWFNALPEPQHQKLTELRELILEVDARITEEIKWGRPCYSINKLICYIQDAKEHVTIGFQQGAHIEDSDGILIGEGKDMRHIKIDQFDEINRTAIIKLITEAAKFDRQ